MGEGVILEAWRFDGRDVVGYVTHRGRGTDLLNHPVLEADSGADSRSGDIEVSEPSEDS